MSNKDKLAAKRYNGHVLGLSAEISGKLDAEELDPEELAFLVDELLSEAGRLKSSIQKYLATEAQGVANQILRHLDALPEPDMKEAQAHANREIQKAKDWQRGIEEQ